MYNSAFLKKLFILCSFFILCSCDKDYNIVGEDLIGNNNFKLEKNYYPVLAYNQKTGAVQSNNLPINALGIFTNSPFGTTTASFVTQISLGTISPKFGANIVLDSVVMRVPYFLNKTITTDATTGIKTYKLDSIYGTPKAPFKLSIYESGYFIRNLDPSLASGLQNKQLYYNDQKDEFDRLKIGNRLNDSPDRKENDEFYFDPAGVPQKTTDAETKKSTTTRSEPSMRLKLNNDFFFNKIIKAPASKLSSIDTFYEYFRGLYFKVEKTGAAENMAMINFDKGTITMYYKEDSSTTTSGVTTVKQVSKTLVLNLKGNTVNFLEQTNPSLAYSNAITSPNTTTGDSKLYLKGGEGSLAVIELFDKTDLLGYDSNGNVTGPNKISDELDLIRKNNKSNNTKWLVNEANLVFHIDENAMKDAVEPSRIYVYNLTNRTPVIDYFTDNTKASASKNNKYIFDGIIKKEATTKKGVTYKIRITNHIKNLINKDSTNVKLGVVLTEDITIGAFSKLKTPNSFSSYLPAASIYNPLGTVLYGNALTAPAEDNKKLRLEIIYTQPK